MLLVASPRVAPGLLSRGGWQALEAADLVLCADPADALPEAVAEAGLDVRPEESPDVATRARASCSGRRRPTSSGSARRTPTPG